MTESVKEFDAVGLARAVLTDYIIGHHVNGPTKPGIVSVNILRQSFETFIPELASTLQRAYSQGYARGVEEEREAIAVSLDERADDEFAIGNRQYALAIDDASRAIRARKG